MDKSKIDPQMLKAAQGMEAMFLDYLMKTMRQTVPKSEMSLENPATEIYRGMLDSEVAQKAARTGGVGMADQIIAYLQPESYTVPRGPNRAPEAYSQAGQRMASPQDPAVVNRRTGGTHEGQSVSE